MARFRREVLLWFSLAVIAVVTIAAGASGDDEAPAEADRPATAQTGSSDTAESGQSGGNLDYWLKRAAPAGEETDDAAAQGDSDEPTDVRQAQQAPGQPEPDAANTEADSDVEDADDAGVPAAPAWALPGVIELSDGTVLAGMMWTAGDQPLEVYVEAEKRWRRVPLAAVLSIRAVVIAERMENVWRWRATGSPQKLYTGQRYPFRRLTWTVTLADGSEITGTIKGQAIHMAGPARGPYVLSERTKGAVGQTLDQLIYARRIVVSRSAMEAGHQNAPQAPQVSTDDNP